MELTDTTIHNAVGKMPLQCAVGNFLVLQSVFSSNFFEVPILKITAAELQNMHKKFIENIPVSPVLKMQMSETDFSSRSNH